MTANIDWEAHAHDPDWWPTPSRPPARSPHVDKAPALAITLYLADDWRRVREPRGQVIATDWAWLVARARRPCVAPHKDAHGGYVFARLTGGHRAERYVESVSALVIDHDAGQVTARNAARRLSRYRCVIHTTHSHTPEAPRWRAHLALSRSVTTQEHAVVWAHVAAVLAAGGLAVDRACSDPARLWFVPCVRAGAVDTHEAYAHNGELLDVDGLLTLEAKRRARHRPRPAPRAAPRHDGRYVAAALEGAARAVARATPGERHHTVLREAWSLARFDLPATEIHATLVPAFVATAGESRRREGSRAIMDAIRARRGGA